MKLLILCRYTDTLEFFQMFFILDIFKLSNWNAFCRFYEEFKKSNETHLESFFRKYHPLISADHHTCVGLSLELIKELSVLEEQYSGFIDKLFLVSCEECIDDIISYTSELPDPYDSEKEHVLLALKFSISDRCGILLLDPGYHIGRVITVMNDGDYPHTGEYLFSFLIPHFCIFTQQ